MKRKEEDGVTCEGRRVEDERRRLGGRRREEGRVERESSFAMVMVTVVYGGGRR